MNPHCRIGRVRRKGLGNVVTLPCITSLDIAPSRVLAQSLEVGMQSVVVIGVDPTGEYYFASSAADGGDVLWLLEVMRKRLLETTGR